MPATRTAMINIAPQLPPTAQTGHVLPGLSTGSLISIGHLCDNDCTAIFSKYHVHIIKDGSLIIKGPRNKSNGLWTIPIAPTSSPLTNPANLPPHLACSAINVTSTKSDLAAFLRGTVFSPTLSTFLRAIKPGPSPLGQDLPTISSPSSSLSPWQPAKATYGVNNCTSNQHPSLSPPHWTLRLLLNPVILQHTPRSPPSSTPKNPAALIPTRLDNPPSYPAKATNMCSSSTIMTPTLIWPHTQPQL